MSENSLYTILQKLAKEHSDYEDFREAALKAIPPELRPSVGPHLMDLYIEYKYGEV